LYQVQTNPTYSYCSTYPQPYNKSLVVNHHMQPHPPRPAQMPRPRPRPPYINNHVLQRQQQQQQQQRQRQPHHINPNIINTNLFVHQDGMAVRTQ
jgi:hypothetical protein